MIVAASTLVYLSDAMGYKLQGILDSPFEDTSKLKIAPQTIAIRLWKEVREATRPAIFQHTPEGEKKKLGRTAYLDGVRGFMAFLVYFHHHILWVRDLYPDIFQSGFGFGGQHYFAAFPFIRTAFTGGHFAVSVFFVLSGYVLSAKPLSLIQAGEYEKLGDNISSALFRRWLRLWIPVAATTFAYMTAWHLFGIWTDQVKEKNWIDEFWMWYVKLKNYSFFFGDGGDPFFLYNGHVWSIPVEMRGSILIYTSLMAISRLRRNARLWVEVGLAYYFMYITDGAFMSMFAAGMFLSDLDLLEIRNELPKWLYRFSEYKELIMYHFLVISLYLSGIPSNTNDLSNMTDTFGWYYLSYLKPNAVFGYKWFYLFWSAVLFVACVRHIHWLKRFFECTFCQYLGRVSFALYLVHGPLLFTLGDRLYAAAGWTRESHVGNIDNWINAFPLSMSGIKGLEPSAILPHVIMLPVTLWFAEMVTKLVDANTVKFTQWFYRRCLPTPIPKS